MDNTKEDDLEDFIESSQVPTLRSKIREKRPNYSYPKIPKIEKRKPRKRIRDNKTVSQCLRKVWKKPLSKPTSSTVTKQPANVVTNVTASEEDYVKFASQQQAPNGNGIQAMPSVSLFDQQDNALARYIDNETREEQLEKLLNGFQAEYEQKCAEMERSPVPYADVEHVTSLQSTRLSCVSMELEEVPEKEGCTSVASFQVIGDITPSFSEEIQQMEEMLKKENPLRSDPSLVPVSIATTPIFLMPISSKEIPQNTEPKEANLIVTDDVCLNLTKQKDQNTVENANRILTPKTVFEVQPPANLAPPRVNDVLDLRIKNAPASPHTVTKCSARTLASHRPFIADTTDRSIQTNIRNKRRNVGIQHRPVASFEFTDRNIIVLAQQFEADPCMLQRKLKQIAKTSTEAIWRARDLSTVFTTADPYYANLKHFL